MGRTEKENNGYRPLGHDRDYIDKKCRGCISVAPVKVNIIHPNITGVFLACKLVIPVENFIIYHKTCPCQSCLIKSICHGDGTCDTFWDHVSRNRAPYHKWAVKRYGIDTDPNF